MYGIYMLIWKEPLEFDWDKGNLNKPQSHGLSKEEAESVFIDPHKKIYFDQKHSITERRYLIIGVTNYQRHAFLVATERGGKVRILSARYMHNKEVKLYEKNS